MATRGTRPHPGDWVLSLALPLAFVGVILIADHIEGPKTAFVGVLTAVPMLAAVFGTPRTTTLVAVVTWLSAASYGVLASDGNVAAQRVRLVVIALAGLMAVWAATQRARRERALAEARTQARVAGDQAQHDALTGVLNRWGALAALEGSTIDTWTIAIADIDDFKNVNDSHGHVVGDAYLQAVAHRLRNSLDQHDIVARWGGDEFLLAIALPADEAREVVRRVHSRVTQEPVASEAGPLPALVTMGAVQWSPPDSLDEAIVRADHALYLGKAQGRNRLVIATSHGGRTSPATRRGTPARGATTASH